MVHVPHPEPLYAEWTPPVAMFRRETVEAVAAILLGPAKGARGPVVVLGGRGVGTSTVARLAVRRAAEELRRAAPLSPPWILRTRVRSHRSTHGVAAELLQAVDPTVSAKGFHPTELVAGLLRRVRRSGRPALVVIDDVGPGGPDLSIPLKGLLDPTRFLPEGDDAVPDVRVVVVGVPEARAAWETLDRIAPGGAVRIPLAELSREDRSEILRDRVSRALGQPAESGWNGRLAEKALDRPNGLAGAMEYLRREMLGRSILPTPGAPSAGSSPMIEPPLLAALRRAAEKRRVSIADLRRWEAEFALAEGARPLPSTTFWRRIVRLESVGWVRREVRNGGPGGSRSLVELTAPASVLTRTVPLLGTLPDGGWPRFAPG